MYFLLEMAMQFQEIVVLQSHIRLSVWHFLQHLLKILQKIKNSEYSGSFSGQSLPAHRVARIQFFSHDVSATVSENCIAFASEKFPM